MKQPALSYEIHIKEHVDNHWSEWLGGMALTHLDTGETILTGTLPDQAALCGVLICLCDLGLTLLAMRRIERLAVVQ